jgi:rhamnogalacturonyl hydrolase YesR/catechol 2,3-dioxygenase-like lactoylglutathione lyase family enzyme
MRPTEILRVGAAVLLTLAPAAAQPLGRSEPGFSQPSRAPGVDYVLPNESEVKATLDRILGYFVKNTPYRIIDTATGVPLTDLSKPTRTAGVDLRPGQFNDWDYPMGVALAAMLHAADVTGDTAYSNYTFKNFDFIFDHLDYFRQQAKEFGPQAYGYSRLLQMRELDDCGAIGAALIKAYNHKKDPRYRAIIDIVADHIAHKQFRMPDGTLARRRPQPVSLWVDDLYMSVPFLAQMGVLTGQTTWFDDAARQVIQFSAHLQDRNSGLWDHSWFENTTPDPKFFWGRGAGWAMMATAELLSVLPDDHPARERLLEIFRQGAQGAVATQSGTGLWHQLLDKTDSYLETSASAMFVFAIARGVNRGWLSPAYAPVAQAGWQALATRVRPDGAIEGICVSTTAAYDAVYYYNRPTEIGAMQGYGPTIMAGAEVISMLRAFDVQRTLNTFHYRPKQSANQTGIAHVALRVADLEPTRAFYNRLGFEQFYEVKQGDKTTQAFLKVNDRQFIELYPRTDPSQPLGLMHVCYESSDLEALHAELVKRGADVSAVRKAGAGNLLMTLKDPEGETVEYTQYMSGSRHFEDRGKHLGANRVATMMLGARSVAQDVPAIRRFYIEKLGFTETSPIRLRMPGDSGQEFDLAPAGEGGKPGIQFGVADLAGAAGALKALGLNVTSTPDMITVSDPDGVVLSFSAPSTRRPR